MSGRVTAFLGLGGNMGDPAASMAAALQAIDADTSCSVIAVSSLYRTPPWGKTDQPDFLNAVARIETALSPRGLLSLCLEEERLLKRVRRERWGPRTVDIDILLYGDSAVDEDGLTIPHPRLAERAFVLVPLGEIAPEIVIDGKWVGELLSRLDDSGIKPETVGGEWWRPSADNASRDLP
jgi:2-amino-4-hydroxy-6-hydroxymethyldihydropteridine diphosphokinase